MRKGEQRTKGEERRGDMTRDNVTGNEIVRGEGRKEEGK